MPTGVEHEYVDAAGRERLHVGYCGLTFGAAEPSLDRGEIVELENGDEVIAGRAAGCRNGTLADLVFFDARDLLCERHVLFSVVLVERSRILWSFVHHDELGHCISPGYRLPRPERVRKRYRKSG